MNRIVLVTGGGRRIGAGICDALAREGWSIAFTGRRPEGKMAPRLDALRTLGAPKAAYFPSDVADLAAHGPLLDAVESALGPLCALVNNAGVAPSVRLDVLETTPESFDRLVSTNLRGPFFLTQTAALLLNAFGWLLDRPVDATAREAFAHSLFLTEADARRIHAEER